MVRDLEGSNHFLHSKEGTIQGYPLDMITYGIEVFPLIQELRNAPPRITQPCYADDTGAGGNLGKIISRFKDLQVRGPPQG